MRKRALPVFIALGMITAMTYDLAAQGREYINPRNASDADALPFSGAVWVGDLLFLSGNIGLQPGGGVPDTPEAEARLVMEAIKGTLEEAGLTMDDLVSVQVFCSDVSYYAAFNDVYRTYFTGDFPARAFVGAGDLLFDARFEVMGTASRR